MNGASERGYLDTAHRSRHERWYKGSAIWISSVLRQGTDHGSTPENAALRAATTPVKAAEVCGDVNVQARKTYVSLVSPRRTFERFQRAGTRVNLALRLDGQQPTGRLQSSNIHETMRLPIPLGSVSEVDARCARRSLQIGAR